LRVLGHDALHWSNVGAPSAADAVIMQWALRSGAVVFTHDLDFGAIIAATHARGPSVIQIRSQRVLPSDMLHTVRDALERFVDELAAGAIIAVDPDRARARVLPIGR
jgi:predicted nuclease of predicted toxin-antitoxin system